MNMEARQCCFDFVNGTIVDPGPEHKKKKQSKSSETIQSIDDVRKEMMSKVDKGTTCPCCGFHVQRYSRLLNSAMAASLCWLVFYHRLKQITDYVDMKHAPRFVIKNREIGKLAHWGLVEGKGGKWRATQRGFDFVDKIIEVPERAYLLGNVFQSWSEKSIDVVKALGKKFGYEKLKRGEWT